MAQPITITVEVTEEDLLAGHYAFTHDPEGQMAVEDIVQFHLVPALKYKLHKLRSRRKWDMNLMPRSPNLPKREIFQGVDSKPTGIFVPGHVHDPVEGGWDCPSSPTGKCWYDDQADPNNDSCLFCEEPNERK